MTIAAAVAWAALFAPAPNPAPVVLAQPCPLAGAPMACSDPQAGTIYADPARLRLAGRFYFIEALAHEVGHVWAQQNPGAFERFTAMVNASPSARVAPGERFADTYALCAIGPRMRARMRRELGHYEGTYGEHISRRVLANTCWLLRHP